MTKLLVTAIIAMAFTAGAFAQEPGAATGSAPAPAVDSAPKADSGSTKAPKKKKGKKGKKAPKASN